VTQVFQHFSSWLAALNLQTFLLFSATLTLVVGLVWWFRNKTRPEPGAIVLGAITAATGAFRGQSIHWLLFWSLVLIGLGSGRRSTTGTGCSGQY
jgi:hypothetical protein